MGLHFQINVQFSQICVLRLAECCGMSNVDGERDGLIGDNQVVVFGL